MGKIREEDVVLTNEQVALWLTKNLPESHITELKAHYNPATQDSRKAFAHTVLDSYKWLPTDTTEEEKSKKYCAHLMNKYLKSPMKPNDNEYIAYDKLISVLIDSLVKGDTE